MGVVPARARSFMSHGRGMALATVSSDGVPNVTPMKLCWWYDEDTMVVGDLFMGRTKANVQATGKVSFCVWEDEPREAYKFVGDAEYKSDGAEYELANGELKKKAPDKNLNGAVVIRVSQVFEANSGPNAGQPIDSVQMLTPEEAKGIFGQD